MHNTLWSRLAAKSQRMAKDAFQDIHTIEDWNQKRPGRRQEFLRAVGLDPLPERCDPKRTEYGTLKGNGYRACKIGFQILSDCWTSAVIFYPDPSPPIPAPGVLHLCGHASNGIHYFQNQAIMWARRGYVCLIVETIEQSDNLGEHHGFDMALHERWLALGYTSAGGELWNSLRALDVLADDPQVDSARLGTTGVSGGGAMSFFLAIVDDRVKAVSTLCGISSPIDAIANRHLLDHCDCFYPHNVFGRDISEYGALIAPRAALFCFADRDLLFHPAETKALVDRIRQVYALEGKSSNCKMVTCPGSHGNHPQFDQATSAWFDQHVAGTKHPEVSVGDKEHSEAELSVFNGQSPTPNYLEFLPTFLTRQGNLSLPLKPEDWPKIRQDAVESLKKDIFFQRGPSPSLQMALDGDWLWHASEPNPYSIQTYRGEIDKTAVWFQVIHPKGARPRMILFVAGEGETAQQALTRAFHSVNCETTLQAGFEPRLAADRSPAQEHHLHYPGSHLQSPRIALMRAMALVGITPVMMVVQDINEMVNYLFSQEAFRGVELYLCGRKEAGVAALYAGLLDERISGVILEDSPGSHRTAAPILGILRLLDLPQAVGLMAPRPVALVNPVYSNWTWPERVYQRLDCSQNFIFAENIHAAVEKILR